MEHGGYAVSEVSFEQREGEKIAIAGEAGSGKTTLLKMVAGLLQPQAGEIYFMGERVKGPDEVLIPGHKKIAYLSQHFELRNNYHVYEVLDMANKIEAVSYTHLDVYKRQVCNMSTPAWKHTSCGR